MVHKVIKQGGFKGNQSIPTMDVSPSSHFPPSHGRFPPVLDDSPSLLDDSPSLLDDSPS